MSLLPRLVACDRCGSVACLAQAPGRACRHTRRLRSITDTTVVKVRSGIKPVKAAGKVGAR